MGQDGVGAPRALVGCHGNVGHAVLALLEQSDPVRRLRERLGEIVLADRRPPPGPVSLEGSRLLPPTDLRSADDLARFIRGHHLTQVIDLSSIDTIECTQVCDDLGADFLYTSVEEWAGHPSLTTERLEPARLELG